MGPTPAVSARSAAASARPPAAAPAVSALNVPKDGESGFMEHRAILSRREGEHPGGPDQGARGASHIVGREGLPKEEEGAERHEHGVRAGKDL